MSRRREQRVAYHLDAGGVESLRATEIAAILRGTDSMIGRGGRTQLSKLLKGSRETTVIEHGLDHNPAYGFYRDLTLVEILRRIDWTIKHHYLRVVYDHRLPLLVFTEMGWAIEVENMATELLNDFDTRLAAGPPYDLSELKDRDRGMIFLLLDKLEASGRPDYAPQLLAWYKIDYKKVRARIKGVIRSLGFEISDLQDPGLPDPAQGS